MVLVWAIAPACSFDPSGSGGGSPGDPDATPGTPDATGTADATALVECEAGELLCSGHAIETCNEAGDGYVPGARVLCPLSCAPNGGDPVCTVPSNLDEDAAAACDGDHALAPTSGTVVIRQLAGVERIECDPDCGDDETFIERAGTFDQSGTEVAWFCLSQVSIPVDVNVQVAPGVSRSIAFLVDGNVNIAGTISVPGRAGVAGDGALVITATGVGGPGGFDGGAAAADNSDGSPGDGTCGGEPGQISAADGMLAGSGGGGGGHAAAAGDGGDGKSLGDPGNGDDGTVVTGGAGGDDTCAGDGTLIPLRGGAGGASGGDGECGGLCGWPGGGGGGALQISARGDLSISGTINASGGAGASRTTALLARGGAGGGGAGGAVLLEGARLLLAGASVVVVGGAGGAGGAGPGGAGGGVGAQAGMLGGQSATATPDDGEGGGGGGGAAGQVRLNAITMPSCGAIVTPATACDAGVVEQQ